MFVGEMDGEMWVDCGVLDFFVNFLVVFLEEVGFVDSVYGSCFE